MRKLVALVVVLVGCMVVTGLVARPTTEKKCECKTAPGGIGTCGSYLCPANGGKGGCPCTAPTKAECGCVDECKCSPCNCAVTK